MLAAWTEGVEENHLGTLSLQAFEQMTVSMAFRGIKVRELHPHIYSTVPLTPFIANNDYGI